MTTYQRESIKQCQVDMLPLIEAHWQEVALHRDVIALAPDFDRYAAAEKQGWLFIVTARRATALLGYAVFFAAAHIHYRQCMVAMNDVVFVKSDHRGIVGARLLQHSERLLRESFPGQLRVMWHVKTGHDWSPILERMGYAREEVVMGKHWKE